MLQRRPGMHVSTSYTPRYVAGVTGQQKPKTEDLSMWDAAGVGLSHTPHLARSQSHCRQRLSLL
jgi:hypothetical protein